MREPAAASSAPLRSPAYRLLVFFVWCALLVVATGVVIAAMVYFDPELATQPTLQVTPLAVSFLIAHMVMIRRYHSDGGAYVGLDPAAFAAKRIVSATLVGVLAIGVPSALLLATGELRIEGAAVGPGNAWWALFALLAVLIPAALWEELAFRGYLLAALKERFGTWTALLFTSALFGLVHLSNPGASVRSTAAVAIAGIFLGLIRFWSGSLYAVWAAHLAWNLTMAIGLRTPVSGTDFTLPGYRVVDAGPDWLTGGAWGPEGGVAAMLAMSVASWYMVRRMRREERTT